ncbi:MAG TPA: ribose 5-phosphate isomerase A, partial [Dokdonella sp.]|nr:ribose 5-phosphate isomerase A [Dokdonella sp.]
MSNEEGKRRAARAAMRFVEPGMIVGVGTGSTVAHFIDALGERRGEIDAAVSSSEQSTRLLKERGIEV